MSKSSQNHPYYTFVPVQHRPLREAILGPTMSFLQHISAFLEEKRAYGNLILDDLSLPLISCYFSSQELTQMRLLTKEHIGSAREKQRDMFAVYIVSYSTENLKEIENDFGGAPIMSFEQVKKVRNKAICCTQPNRYFNPYSYRGLFAGFLQGDIEQIQKDFKKSNLAVICSEVQVLNLVCIIPRRRFADLGIKDGFAKIMKNNTEQYENEAAQKLNAFFSAVHVKPIVRFQKTSKICQNIFEQLQFGEGDENAQLILLDRTIDCLTPIALPETFTAMFDELRDGKDHITIKYDKAGQKDVVEDVVVNPMEVRHIGQFGIIEGINEIYKGFNDYKELREGTESFSDKEYGSLHVTRLKQNEELMMQGEILKLNNTMWNLFKCAKFVDNKILVLENFHIIQCMLFQAIQTGNFQTFYKQEIPGAKVPAMEYLLSVAAEFPYEVARILILAGVIVEQQTSVLSREAETILEKLNSPDIFGSSVPISQYHANIFKYYSLFSRRCQELQPLLAAKYGKDVVQTPISAVELIADAILRKTEADNTVLQPQYKLSFNPFLAKSAWDENQELQVSKSQIIMEENSRLAEYDTEMFTEKHKVFIYMAGGITSTEISAVTRILEKDWGRLGVFNKGIEKEWDVEFYLISDGELSLKEFFDEICQAAQ